MTSYVVSVIYASNISGRATIREPVGEVNGGKAVGSDSARGAVCTWLVRCMAARCGTPAVAIDVERRRKRGDEPEHVAPLLVP